MVRALGEKAADILLTALIGALSFLVLRDFEQQRRITALESVVVEESEIEKIDGRLDRLVDGVRAQQDELLRLRESISDMLIPILTERLGDLIDETTNSQLDVDPLSGSGGPE